MSSFKIAIAGCTFEIVPLQNEIEQIFRAFSTTSKPQFEIMVDNDDLELERKKKYGNGDFETRNDIILELSVIQKKISEMVIEKGAFLIHGAAIARKGEAYIFSGKSGVGKTTHIFQWALRDPNVKIINGDKPFVNIQKTPVVCSSPWAGKENIYSNIIVPLKAIICMERAEENHIQEISFAEAFPILLQQTYRPDNEDKLRKTLRLLQYLNGRVKIYRFQCNNFRDDCLEVAYNGLVGNSHG